MKINNGGQPSVNKIAPYGVNETVPSGAYRTDTMPRMFDVLETAGQIGRTRLAEAAGLGVMTVHRAAEQLLDKGIAVEVRGRDPYTKRMTRLLCPSFPFPVLMLDLTEVQPAVFLACGAQAPDTACCARAHGDIRDIYFFEDELQLLVSSANRVLAEGVSELYPVLLLPDTELVRGTSPDVIARIMAGNVRGLRSGRAGREDVTRIRVMRDMQAAVYAAVRDPMLTGKRSLLLVRKAGCRLLTRPQPDGQWDAPPILEEIAREVREVLDTGGAGAERVRTLLSAVTPEAVLCDADTDGKTAALVRALLPDGVPIGTSDGLLAGRGILMRARRDLWEFV